MRRDGRRSDCAINFALESIGDAWSLLIIRDIAFHGKTEFGEFMASDERIGSNTLSRRLAALEAQGIISKRTSDRDRRREKYGLTAKGASLVPLLVELTLWGAAHDPETGADPRQVAAMQRDRAAFIRSIEATAPRDRTSTTRGGRSDVTRGGAGRGRAGRA